jgi:ribosomal protein L37AE/L43A
MKTFICKICQGTKYIRIAEGLYQCAKCNTIFTNLADLNALGKSGGLKILKPTKKCRLTM